MEPHYAALDIPILDAKLSVLPVYRDEFFSKLLKKPENSTCFDCNARMPTWCSLTYSVYLCVDCCGNHRKMGVHLSFVRSTQMDHFTVPQLLQFEIGGNRRALEFYKSHNQLMDGQRVDYYSKAAQKYKSILEKEVANIMKQRAIHNEPTSPVPQKISSSNHNESSSTICQSVLSEAPIQTESNTPEKNVIPEAPKAISTTSVITEKKISGNVKKNVRAAKIDFDFDFDSEPPPPTPLTHTTVKKSDSTCSTPSSTPYGSKNSGNSLNCTRFETAKSIASTDFFHNDRECIDVDSRLSKFANASDISSAQFFSNNEVSSTGSPLCRANLAAGVAKAKEFWTNLQTMGR
eukprot:GHVL01011840.1.p1 GENE.GHVL01011840.1~~GHVL01011840.1.p1  ORF type:complete len:365 (-),score=68.02 GHVL01011840.1:174-1217(-)